jgi:hypothetical protein
MDVGLGHPSISLPDPIRASFPQTGRMKIMSRNRYRQPITPFSFF